MLQKADIGSNIMQKGDRDERLAAAIRSRGTDPPDKSRSTTSRTDDDGHGGPTLGVRETAQLRKFRAGFTFFLLALGIALGAGIYFIIRKQEEADLADSFDFSTTRIVDQVQNSIERKTAALESFSFAITSYARFTNSSWPFVTLPDYHYQAASVRALSQAVAIELSPRVSEGNRDAWETYSADNRQWITAGLGFEGLVEQDFFFSHPGKDRNLLEQNTSDSDITYKINHYDSESGHRVSAPTTETYFPVWQSSPVSSKLVNFDMHSTRNFANEIDLLTDTDQVIIGTTTDVDIVDDVVLQLFHESFNKRNEIKFFNTDGPVGFLYVPVFDTLNSSVREPVAMLTAAMYWETYMFQALPPDTPEILIVLRNDCGDTYTYSILGEHVKYVSIGDLHDGKFDPFKFDSVTFEFESLQSSLERYQGVPLNDHCKYHMEIYPTAAFEAKYLTARPWTFFAMVVGIVMLLITLIYCYDRRVESNYQLVYKRAKRGGAIVSSIFPAAVRRRLYKDDEESRNKYTRKDGSSSMALPRAVNARFKITGFLSHSGGHQGTEDRVCSSGKDALTVHATENNIVDLFPDVTICFCDIVGFAEWSSLREPVVVFTFLEDLYHDYDTKARAMGVFKVETIGDCYVAATGLPEAQADHAVRMARFAGRLTTSIVEVAHSLEARLGPDTGELTTRIGLHSGPVTAGVLKGARRGFQLFGDTMNTAARMEQSSVSGRIQCSEATANLLRRDGMGHWVHAREGKLSLKGKGEVQTFWVTP